MIERGGRIALVGVNGAGKSTLIKLLARQEKLSAGEYKLGHEVHLDYFAQDQYKELDPEARILDDLGELSGASTQTELRSLLGCFLFSGDDVFKRISVLSGGERNRYALLKMLLHPANFLLLDEPTNHLDLRAKDVLLEALMKYTGTVVFVSHDRYFIDNLATRVFEIGDGKVEIYPGNYEDYLWRKQGREAVAVERPKPSAVSSSVPVNGDRSSAVETRLAASPAASSVDAVEPKGKRLNPIKRQQMEDRLHELEEEIARAEAAIALNETELQRFVSAEETQRQNQELAKVKSTLQKLMSEWEELSGMLETTG
jgi:ATP-binding cassette subfamily F protein 3